MYIVYVHVLYFMLTKVNSQMKKETCQVIFTDVNDNDDILLFVRLKSVKMLISVLRSLSSNNEIRLP